MRYAHLTPEHQVQVLTERLLNLEARHYQLERNKAQYFAQAEAGTPEVHGDAEAKAVAIEHEQAAIDIAYAADLAAREELEPKKRNDAKLKVKM